MNSNIPQIAAGQRLTCRGSIVSARYGILPAVAMAALLMVLPNRAAAQANTNKDMVFRTVGARKLMIDLYSPQSAPPANGYPVIVSIHGGAWSGADRHNDLILRKLTNQGYALASIDYRLSGEAKYPAQIDDTREAVRWLMEHAASLSIDTNKMVATGISAGAHLALLLGLSQPPGDHTIKAVCALYPPTDLVALIAPERRDDKSNAVAALLGGSVNDKLALAREASPITYARKDSVPVLIYHGDQDKLVPVQQSISLDAALKAAGAQSTLVIYPGKGHAFGLGDEALLDVAKFFERSLKN